MSVVVLLAAFLLGTIPFGLLLTRAAGLGDIRKIGSGNIGATNVLRTGRRGLAAATVLLDGGKGVVAVLLARQIAPEVMWACAVLAVLGHCYSIWLGGKGGKGVATGLGVLLAGYWPVGVACCAIWLVAAKLGKRSSAASLSSFILAPLLLLVAGQAAGAIAAVVIALQIALGHRGNIKRLLRGTEPRIGDAP